MRTEKIKKIIELGRFRFLVGGFFLYLMGALLASVSQNDFSVILFIIGYGIMLPAHLSLSYSNNYFDQNVDQFNTPESISGGTKILIDHPELRYISKYISIGLIVLSIVIAGMVTFLLRYSLWFFAFVIIGNLIGWFYTAPPLRLAYRGLGEIANMINMAFLMPGIGYWVMKGSIDGLYLALAFGFLLYGFEFMIIVESPDLEGDRLGGKNTLVVTKGRRFSYVLLLAAVLIASMYYIIVFLLGYFQQYVNFLIIFFLSLIPAIIAFLGLMQKPFDQNTATRIAKQNMITLILFVVLIDIYFVFLI